MRSHRFAAPSTRTRRSEFQRVEVTRPVALRRRLSGGLSFISRGSGRVRRTLLVLRRGRGTGLSFGDLVRRFRVVEFGAFETVKDAPRFREGHRRGRFRRAFTSGCMVVGRGNGVLTNGSTLSKDCRAGKRGFLRGLS